MTFIWYQYRSEYKQAPVDVCGGGANELAQRIRVGLTHHGHVEFEMTMQSAVQSIR